MIDKIAESEIFKEELASERVENLARFVYGISAELAMKAWERLTLANPDNVTSMWEVIVDEDENTTFGNYIAKIAGSAKE